MTSNENFIITGFPLTLKMWFKNFCTFLEVHSLKKTNCLKALHYQLTHSQSFVEIIALL